MNIVAIWHQLRIEMKMGKSRILAHLRYFLQTFRRAPDSGGVGHVYLSDKPPHEIVELSDAKYT